MIIGVVFTLIGDYNMFAIGRFIEGICVGYYSFLTPLYLREISPIEISGILGSFFVLFVRGGALVTFSICMLLPLPSKVKPNDQWWRLEIGFPFFLVVTQVLALLLVYRYDTPKGCLLKGDKEQVFSVFHFNE